MKQQVNFEVSVLFAGDVYQFRPPRPSKLCANRFKIRGGVLAAGIKFKTSDEYSFQSLDELFDLAFVGILVGEELLGHLY